MWAWTQRLSVMAHFLDESPYPFSQPAARELRNVLASAFNTTSQLEDLLASAGLSRADVFLDKPARYVWHDVLKLVALREGGARGFLERVVEYVKESGYGALKELLSKFLTDRPPQELSAKVREPVSPAAVERVLGSRSAFVDPAWLPQVVEAASSVVWLQVSFADSLGHGTGFLIGARHVLTNHHVLFLDGEQASSIDVRFDYESDLSGALAAPNKLPGLVATISPAEAHDVAVFELATDPPRRPDGSLRLPLKFDEIDPRVEEKVAIIQHPGGTPKKVAFHTVVKVGDGLVHYLADTEPGSSGSPVLGRNGRVVALHHASQEVKLGTNPTQVNEGIAASRVIAALLSLGVAR